MESILPLKGEEKQLENCNTDFFFFFNNLTGKLQWTHTSNASVATAQKENLVSISPEKDIKNNYYGSILLATEHFTQEFQWDSLAIGHLNKINAITEGFRLCLFGE